jgi:energy-coupling factor transporter ATP-binding protein EcfA2
MFRQTLSFWLDFSVNARIVPGSFALAISSWGDEMSDDKAFAIPLIHWAWENRKWVKDEFKALISWFSSSREIKGANRFILIIGPGGVGKSTAARMLAGDIEASTFIPEPYAESVSVERVRLADDNDVEIVVLPGQTHRRDSTWAGIEAQLASGHYRGVVMICAYGYHSLGDYLSPQSHKLYQKDAPEKFLESFLAEGRTEELRVVEHIAGSMIANQEPFWLLTLVAKQDLWWDQREAVEVHYREGEYGQKIAQLQQQLNPKQFRHECVFTSQVIRNFESKNGQLIAKVASGYDQIRVGQSFQKLCEVLDGLRTWEGTV